MALSRDNRGVGSGIRKRQTSLCYISSYTSLPPSHPFVFDLASRGSRVVSGGSRVVSGGGISASGVVCLDPEAERPPSRSPGA